MIPFGIFLAIIRILIATHILELSAHPLAFYTAIAHVYIGVLLCDWWHNRITWKVTGCYGYSLTKRIYTWPTLQPCQWRFFWFMNTVEIVCFLIDKKLIPFL